MGVHDVSTTQRPRELRGNRLRRMPTQQPPPPQHADLQAVDVDEPATAAAEGHQLAVDVARKGPGQLQRVPFPATKQPTGPERGGHDLDDAHRCLPPAFHPPPAGSAPTRRSARACQGGAVADPRLLRIALITLGDPATLTGGYLYHRRIAALAPEFSAIVNFVSFPERALALPALAGRGVVRAAARTRPHVLLLDSIAAPYLATWLGRVRLPAPLTAILHQPPGGIDAAPWRIRVQARLDRRAYRHARLLIAASDALADGLRGDVLEGQSLVVVAPGRDTTAGTADCARAEVELRRGRNAALLCVGNWVERKGVLDLLEAVARLPDTAATLHLVGDPDPEPAYAKRIRGRLRTPELAGRVVVHGRLTAAEVAACYRAADVFVLPSKREPYGTAYGEAMAAGLPAVGWEAGNLPNLARHGQEGLVLPVGDIPALTAALHRLCDDGQLRSRLAAAARRRAQTFPTWHDSAERLFAHLRAAADG